MKNLAMLAAILLLAGCFGRDSGQQAAAPAPQPAPVAIAHVSFVGDDPVKKRSLDDLGDRILEKLTLRNGATVVYMRLKDTAYPGTYTDSDALRVDMADPFYKDRDIHYDRVKVKKSGAFTYLLQSSPAFHCFMFHHNFGVNGPRGDQQLLGSVCYPVTSIDAEGLKAEMLDLLNRLRVDGAAIPVRAAANG